MDKQSFWKLVLYFPSWFMVCVGHPFLSCQKFQTQQSKPNQVFRNSCFLSLNTPFVKYMLAFWLILIIWSLDEAERDFSIWANVLKWEGGSGSEYLTHNRVAPAAAPRIDLPKIEEYWGDPRYIFGNAAQDVSGGGRRYIRGNLLVGKTRKIWKGCRWFDWDGDLSTIYYLLDSEKFKHRGQF